MSSQIKNYTMDENLKKDARWAYYAKDLTGNAADNVITGNNQNNIIKGGEGDDRMAGGRGNDTYYVDSLNDVVVETRNAGTDTVYLENSAWTLNDVKDLYNNWKDIEYIFLNGTDITDDIHNSGPAGTLMEQHAVNHYAALTMQIL